MSRTRRECRALDGGGLCCRIRQQQVIGDVNEFSDEPTINDRVTIETRHGSHEVLHKATMANVTADEIWLAVGVAAAALLVVGSSVGVVLHRPDDQTLAAETTVKRVIGSGGRLIALQRPTAWTSHSRRHSSRVGLAIPAYLHPAGEDTVASARTTNIGIGGFHCVTELCLSVGDQMGVTLMFTPTTQFECQAQVVRLRDDPEDASHVRLVAAFRFLDLSPESEAHIAEALAALGGVAGPETVPAAWHSDAPRSGLG